MRKCRFFFSWIAEAFQSLRNFIGEWAAGWLSAKRELRSSRKGLRDASEAVAKLIVEN